MNSLALSATRRPEFSGVTDVYAPPLQNDKLALAKRGLEFYDVAGVVSPDIRDRTNQRLARYDSLRKMYNGEHFPNMIDRKGVRKFVLNYCDLITNVGADWLAGNGVEFCALSGNEPIAELLNSVMEANGGTHLLWETGFVGGLTGDVFVYVTVSMTDEAGKELPKERWTVSVNLLDPSWVTPTFNATRPGVMSQCVIQFPLSNETGVDLFTMVITPDKFETWLNEEKKSTQPNPFGCVNVVHIPNMKASEGLFGQSDIDAIQSLNIEIDMVGGSIRRVIQYHGEPTTIIYGASIGSLERGADKLWSGLPADAKVENLELKGDLEPTIKWFEQLKKAIAVKAEVPIFILDAETPKIANTSGLAMQMMYQPLISKNTRKRHNYKLGFIAVGKLILTAHEKILGDDLSSLTDSPEKAKVVGVKFTSLLPKDEQTELDLAGKRLAAGIWSQAEAIRQCSGVQNVSRLALELAADFRQSLAKTAEEARANNGQTPVMEAAFLGSPFLTEDLEAIAEESANASDEAQK